MWSSNRPSIFIGPNISNTYASVDYPSDAAVKGGNLMIVIAVIGVLALFVAIKITRAILRLVFGLIGLAAIGGAVWWFFMQH